MIGSKMHLAEQQNQSDTFRNAIHTYWVFQNVINLETCEQIINLGKDKWMKAKIEGKKEIDTKTRRTDVAWSNDDWLYQICWDYLHTANRNSNWNFEISSCEPMQITKYKKNGHYEFHQDGNGFSRYDNTENKFLHNKTRKLSMTIVLNEDYEGGEFEFFQDINLIKEKMGTVIVFPSYMVHKVRPVTKGTRYSLVAWFCGQPFK
jgi:PKHD-type hydroxylase